MLTHIALPPRTTTWPHSAPFLSEGTTLPLEQPITLLVGENGSGKSTFLEALAIATDVPAAGTRDRPSDDPTLAHLLPLVNDMKLTWTARSRRGMFLRAEDFFGYIEEQNRLDLEASEAAKRIAEERPDVSERELARMQGPFLGPVAARQQAYNGGLHDQSHGEAFISFFQRRLRGPGLYLLDEPEAALDPTRQLAFLALVEQATQNGAQFVIATHSVILAAQPKATIYELREGVFHATAWEDLEHVQLTRSFLDQPAAFLRHLADA